MNKTCLAEKMDRTFTIPHQMYEPNQCSTLATLGEVVDENYDNYVEYAINQYGFRYKEPVTSEVLVSVGCSITFGSGLPYDKTYPYLLSNFLGLENVNVALPGTGPDVQCLNAIWAVSKYNPKMVVFYMSDTNRRSLAARKNVVNLVPGYTDHIFTSENEKKYFYMLDVRFSYTRVMNTAYQLYALNELCKSKNIPIYFRCWEKFSQDQLREFEFTKDFKIIPDMNMLDLARDKLHHGIKSHEDFADRLLDVIKVQNN